MFIHSPPPPPTQPMPLTIFVHGTQMHALVKDRDVRAYFPAETQTPTGLTTAESLPATHQISRILHTLSTADCQAFPFEGMYAFGWSGSIEVEERRSAAKALFDLIQSLAQAYDHIHHAPPEITVITHSHGGNVVLHMAEVCDTPCYILKRTVFLACPIQERTAPYSSNPFFNTIYSLHSHHDLGQTLDQEALQHIRTAYADQTANVFNFGQMLFKEIQSTKWKLGSGRHFEPPFHVRQAEVVWQSEPQRLLH